jgi:hypothetical protein
MRGDRVDLPPLPFCGEIPQMNEVWLWTNRRAVLFGCALPLMLSVLGAWLTFGIDTEAGNWLRWLGAAMIVVGIATVAALLRQIVRPRIAYGDGQVFFHLRSGKPFAVPVQIVESFFVGQGPATLPGGVQDRRQTANLVARLSQRETDWARRDVKPSLGKWCDGYVTINGTWCEPLDDVVLRRLNRRLHEVKQQAGA